MFDSCVAASAYRTRRQLEVETNPVCRVLDASIGLSQLPILEELTQNGCFQLVLPPRLVELNEAVFSFSRTFLDLDEDHELKRRHAIVDGSLNGYHPWGGLSKYNTFRNGFIFENRDVLDLLGEKTESNSGRSGITLRATATMEAVSAPLRQQPKLRQGLPKGGQEGFICTIHLWREAHHDLAAGILARLSTQLGLEKDNDEEVEGGAKKGDAFPRRNPCNSFDPPVVQRFHHTHDEIDAAGSSDRNAGGGRSESATLVEEHSSTSPFYFEREMRFRGLGQLHIKQCQGDSDKSDDAETETELGSSSSSSSAKDEVASPKNTTMAPARRASDTAGLPSDADGAITRMWMPPHTDPSLITLLVHDKNDRCAAKNGSVGNANRGGEIGGAMGLEVYHRGRRRYEALPRGGWSVATVLAGDVLAKVCRGAGSAQAGSADGGCESAGSAVVGRGDIHAPMHRVVARSRSEMNLPRVAATIFIQPALDAPLRPIPCHPSRSAFKGSENLKKKKNAPGVLTYGAWKEQKYLRYFKKKSTP